MLIDEEPRYAIY